MKSLSTIISELQGTADALGYEGPVTEALIYLLADAVYKNEITAVNAVLEASPSKCINLNSSIQHAYDNFYSVYRGKNQTFNITNLRPIKNFKVKKYDQMVRVGNYGLYYAQDYEFHAEVINTGGIDVIVAKTMNEGTLTMSNSVTHFTIADTDVSEDIAIWSGDTISDYEQNITGMFTEFTKGDGNYEFLAITTTDYSVDIFSKSPIASDDIYYYRHLPYIETDIDLNSLKTIPNFTIVSGTAILGTSTGVQTRLSDRDQIFYNTMTVAKSGFTIRSASDIIDLALAYFHGVIAGINVVISDTDIDIYYTTSSLDTSSTLNSTEIANFINQVSTAYYITQDINFHYATPMYGIGTSKKVSLLIHYQQAIDQGSVRSYYDTYRQTVGGTFNTYKFIASLCEKFSSIKYIEINDISSSDTVITADLGDTKFMDAGFEGIYDAVTIES